MAEIWGAALIAGGAVAGATISASGAKSAANAQTTAAESANQTQLAELQATAGLQTPGRNLGYGADSLLAQLYGLPDPNSTNTTGMYSANSSLNAIGGNPAGTSSATGAQPSAPGMSTAGNTAVGPLQGAGAIGSNAAAANTAAGGSALPANAPAGASSQFSNFYNAPGYQFALQQGQQGVSRAAAAGGNLYSTGTLNQLDQNAQGYASGQYNNYVSQLMGLAGLGASATNQTQAGATTAGNNISANQLSAGNANASGILGSASAFGGAVNNVGGALGNYSALTSGTNPNSYVGSNGQNQYSGLTQGPSGGGIGNIVGDF
jgi:hypothetical protein